MRGYVVGEATKRTVKEFDGGLGRLKGCRWKGFRLKGFRPKAM
mgnify:CR=1 FL=1